MPTKSEEWLWSQRHVASSKQRPPVHHDIDHEWSLVKSIVNPDGGFNGGIDLVKKKDNGELAIRKRLRPHKTCDEHDCIDWLREMLIMRKLNHPNIPYYIDGFVTPKRGSLYMQPCRLGSVNKFVDQRKYILPFEMQEYFLWYILHEVAQAVLYLQTGFETLADWKNARSDELEGWLCIVHGDIRTDQVFLDNNKSDPTPRVLLGDFGFSQFIKPWHRTEEHDGVGGRSHSKAPEFPGEVSSATDIFGLGALAQLYLRPHEKVKAGLRTGKLTKVGLSHDLDELICDCVAFHPADRPSVFTVLRKLEWGLRAQKKKGLA